MNDLETRLTHLLTETERPAPPEGLLAALVREIPATLGDAGDDGARGKVLPFVKRHRAQVLAAAASLFVMVGSGYLLVRSKLEFVAPSALTGSLRDTDVVAPPAPTGSLRDTDVVAPPALTGSLRDTEFVAPSALTGSLRDAEITVPASVSRPQPSPAPELVVDRRLSREAEVVPTAVPAPARTAVPVARSKPARVKKTSGRRTFEPAGRVTASSNQVMSVSSDGLGATRYYYEMRIEPPATLGGAFGSTSVSLAFAASDSRTWTLTGLVSSDREGATAPSLDTSTASYTLARRYLADGYHPPRGAVRVGEIVSFLDYGDPPPALGDLEIAAHVAPRPFPAGNERRLLRIGVRARAAPREERRPATLVFVVDTSGSMAGQRLELVKRSLMLLASGLRDDDRVGVVTFGGGARVVLEPDRDRGRLRQALDGLRAEGPSDVPMGLEAGYDVALRTLRVGISRVVLCTGGLGTAETGTAASLAPSVERYRALGIGLGVVGFGLDGHGYDDAFLRRLASAGRGGYAYVDGPEEARRVFGEVLPNSLETVARDVKGSVEWNPAIVTAHRLLGSDDPDRSLLSAESATDALGGDMGAGQTASVLYEIELKGGLRRFDRLATVRLRYEPGDRPGKTEETSREILGADVSPTWESAPAGFRLASLAAEYAEVLRGKSRADPAEVARRTDALVPDAPQARELADLVRRAAGLRVSGPWRVPPPAGFPGR